MTLPQTDLEWRILKPEDILPGEAPPVLTLQQMLDSIYELEQQKALIEKHIKEVKGEVLEMMLAQGIKKETASNGIGYQVGITSTYEYQRPAYDYLEAKGLLGEFVGKPKITKTKLEELRKDDRINYADMAEIEKWTIPTQEYTLRKVAAKEVPA